MSDPVDDPLIDLNTSDQHVAADVVGRWKQIRVDNVTALLVRCLRLSWRQVSIDVYFGPYVFIRCVA